MLNTRYPGQGKPAYYENTETFNNCGLAGTPQHHAVIELLFEAINDLGDRVRALEAELQECNEK